MAGIGGRRNLALTDISGAVPTEGQLRYAVKRVHVGAENYGASKVAFSNSAPRRLADNVVITAKNVRLGVQANEELWTAGRWRVVATDPPEDSDTHITLVREA